MLSTLREKLERERVQHHSSISELKAGVQLLDCCLERKCMVMVVVVVVHRTQAPYFTPLFKCF